MIRHTINVMRARISLAIYPRACNFKENKNWRGCWCDGTGPDRRNFPCPLNVGVWLSKSERKL